MTDLGFYEKVIPQISHSKLRVMKIAAWVLTALAIVLWILQSALVGRDFVWIFVVSLLVAVVPIVVFGFLCTDLEISITQNEISLARIYGKRSRKTLFCADDEDILIIVRSTEAGMARVEEKNVSLFFSAVDKKAADTENTWLVVFRYDTEQNACLELELEDEAKKLLRGIKPAAFSQR